MSATTAELILIFVAAMQPSLSNRPLEPDLPAIHAMSTAGFCSTGDAEVVVSDHIQRFSDSTSGQVLQSPWDFDVPPTPYRLKEETLIAPGGRSTCLQRVASNCSTEATFPCRVGVHRIVFSCEDYVEAHLQVVQSCEQPHATAGLQSTATLADEVQSLASIRSVESTHSSIAQARSIAERELEWRFGLLSRYLPIAVRSAVGLQLSEECGCSTTAGTTANTSGVPHRLAESPGCRDYNRSPARAAACSLATGLQTLAMLQAAEQGERSERNSERHKSSSEFSDLPPILPEEAEAVLPGSAMSPDDWRRSRAGAIEHLQQGEHERDSARRPVQVPCKPTLSIQASDAVPAGEGTTDSSRPGSGMRAPVLPASQLLDPLELDALHGAAYAARDLNGILRDECAAPKSGTMRGVCLALRAVGPAVRGALLQTDVHGSPEETELDVASVGLNLTRPNSMNRQGVVLAEIGLRQWAQAMVRGRWRLSFGLSLPEWDGGAVDDWHVFTVAYRKQRRAWEDGNSTDILSDGGVRSPGPMLSPRLWDGPEPDGVSSLSRHMDESEITLNACLERQGGPGEGQSQGEEREVEGWRSARGVGPPPGTLVFSGTREHASSRPLQDVAQADPAGYTYFGQGEGAAGGPSIGDGVDQCIVLPKHGIAVHPGQTWHAATSVAGLGRRAQLVAWARSDGYRRGPVGEWLLRCGASHGGAPAEEWLLELRARSDSMARRVLRAAAAGARAAAAASGGAVQEQHVLAAVLDGLGPAASLESFLWPIGNERALCAPSS